MPTITPQPTFTSGNLINWDSYNKALTEIKLQDNYGTAFRILNEAEMSPEQVLQLPAPTGASAYGYKNYADGAIATWYSNYSSTVENVPEVATQINSNAAAGATNTYNWQFSANTDYSGGGSGGSTGSTFYGSDVAPAGGASSAISFIQNTVTPAVAAAGLGIKLGKAIDSTLYNLNPDFWDNNGMAGLNPEKWNSITMDMSDSGWEGVLKRGFNAIFGLNSETNKSQMYIDADAAAYLSMYMQEKGIFAPSQPTYNPPQGYTPPQSVLLPNPLVAGLSAVTRRNSTYSLSFATGSGAIIGYEGTPTSVRTTAVAWVAISANPFTFNNGGTITTAKNATATVNGVTFTYYYETGYYQNSLYDSHGDSVNYIDPFQTVPIGGITDALAYIILYGKKNEGGNVEGITNQDGATQPDFSNCETPADYKQALQQQYPDMFQNAITQNVAQPDGTVVQHVYIPVGTPTGTGDQPTTDPSIAGQSQGQTEADPTTSPETLTQTILDILTKTFTPTNTPTDTTNPRDTGEGDTPTVVPPTGSASALWTVYNPSQAQLNSFGAWLWSSNFIDQVLKLFNNPMQSIIGVHKIFAAPAISGSNNITVGYLDSGVPANVVGAQYTTIDCGTVNVREQFGNVFDYEDTQIRLYLPFIGIVALDTSDAMRGSVQVVYHVDVITGACLAEVKITRDGSGGTLYQFAGDAAVRYPISSGSYMGVVSGVLGVVGGIASGIMSGGATLPMAAGAIAGGMSQAKTQVQHSGSFAGNAGAMGGKKPYLIIERPQAAVADGYGNYQGIGSNRIASVGSMSGYFKMTDVHTASVVGASEAEIAGIVQALESGVIA